MQARRALTPSARRSSCQPLTRREAMQPNQSSPQMWLVEPWVKAADVAAHLNCSPKTVLRWARLEIIPSSCDRTMKRKHRLFKISDVDAVLKLMYSHASYPCRH